MVKVKLYVEGGGDSRSSLHINCREGFRKLLEAGGILGRMPSTKACGRRNAAYGDFRTALRTAAPDEYPFCWWTVKRRSISLHGSTLRHVTGGSGPLGQRTTKRNSSFSAWRVGALRTESALREFFGDALA